MRIAHLTSAHPRNDIRIFYKQCCSLQKHGYQVYLIVADGNGNEQKQGISIIDVGKSKNRFYRMFKSTINVLKKAIEIDCDVYQLHDPELLPIGLVLKMKGKIIIFDSHEDVSSQILDKEYIAYPLRKIISLLYEIFEKNAFRKYNFIFSATPYISEKIRKHNSSVLNINNYPFLEEFNTQYTPYNKRFLCISYIGSLSNIRGIKELVQAMEWCNKEVTLKIAGSFNSKILEEVVKNYLGWKKVKYYGLISRDEVNQILSESLAGIITFLPVKNHVNAQPNKIFEYMSAGIPVICSDFPLWKDIVEGNRCGICVNPEDPKSISKAIDWVINNPIESEIMGKNGLEAVKEKYNWVKEEVKLLNLYKELQK